MILRRDIQLLNDLPGINAAGVSGETYPDLEEFPIVISEFTGISLVLDLV